MSEETRRIRWPWLLGSLIPLALFFAVLSLFWLPDGRPEIRPLGSLADIEALSERDDTNVLFILVPDIAVPTVFSCAFFSLIFLFSFRLQLTFRPETA